MFRAIELLPALLKAIEELESIYEKEKELLEKTDTKDHFKEVITVGKDLAPKLSMFLDDLLALESFIKEEKT